MANKDNSEAAKKIAKAEKAKTAKKPKNKENVFVRAAKKIKKFFKDLRGEVKKITWPDAKTVIKGTVVTIVCIAIIGVAVFLVDFGLTNGIDALRSVAENRTTTTTTVASTANSSNTAATSGNAQ